MCVKINCSFSQISSEQWDYLLKNSSTSSFFQSQECFGFYKSLTFFEPFVFSVMENNNLKGVIVGYIQVEKNRIKQFFTKRAVVNGGPLLAEDISDNALEKLLLACAKDLKHKAIYVEMRNFNNYSKWKDVFEKCGFLYQPHYNFKINTTSSVVVDENMGKSRKRDAKISLRDGAVVVDCPCVEDIIEFYSILQELYRTKVKTPLFPFEFFEELSKSKFGRFLLVKYQDRVVGGTVCVCDNKSVFEWFACGEDGVYKNIYPSTLATYAGIQYAVQNGYENFDMMGAGAPNDGGYGVRDFKAKFGGELVEHGRFKCINNKLLYEIGKLGVELLKKKK